MCLVAFQKIFRKIFSGVWKRIRKTQIQKNTSHNPDPVRRPRRRLRSEIAIDGVIAISPSSRDRDRRRDLAKARSRSLRDRDLRRDLAKGRSRSRIFLSCLHTRSRDRRFARSRRRSRSRSGAISRRRYRDQWRDLATTRSRSTATGMFAGEIAIGAEWRSRSRARSLSLSLIFRKYFEGKIEV